MDAEIKKNLSLGIIEPSSSPWSARIVPVPKKTGEIRVCIDYRPLNAVTIKDSYPLPRIDWVLDSLSKATVFSTLDATSGYYQIEMNPEDKEKTAFGWKGGLYQFTRMPFGLCNAPATFQRAMDNIFREERGAFVIPYFDDIIVFSESQEEHIGHLEIVFRKLKQAGLSLNRKKCHFNKTETKILGYVVSKGAVKPDPEKIVAISNRERPETVSQLRSYLGLINMGRDFESSFSQITAPLFNLLKGHPSRSEHQINWTPLALEAFKRSKKMMVSLTERAQPNFNKGFIVTTDASDTAIGGILSQLDDNGRERLVYAFSRIMSPAEKNYSVTDKELLAAVKAIEKFRYYLLGRKFILKTDHQALLSMLRSKKTNSRLLRWSLILQEYDFEISYIRGEENAADVLSRPILQNTLRINTIKTLPNDKIQKILAEYHTVLGHGSPANMKFAIQQKFQWENMFKDIENFVDQCPICPRAGGPRTNTRNRVITTRRPNELWEVDIIGPLPVTKRGNKFILVVVDHFTKWVEATPLQAKETHSVIHFLKNKVIAENGTPEIIRSDQGLEFRNSKTTSFANEMRFKWEFASPHHHNSVGAVERANQTLLHKIRKLCLFGACPWDRYVNKAVTATNYSFNRSIQTSPFIFKYGRYPNLSVDVLANKTPERIDQELLKERRDRNLIRYEERDIRKGKILIKQEFLTGDRVLVFREKLGEKLGSNWSGGFTITKKESPDSYIVTKGKTTLRANKRHLKLDVSN